jgi:hypothetical protein
VKLKKGPTFAGIREWTESSFRHSPG